MNFGPAALAKIEEVVEACTRFGGTSIVVLSGVAGTGKTLLALAAAQKFAGHPFLVKQIQFHQAYTYEDFIEGLQPTADGGFIARPGLFLDWNDAALRDSANRYVLLIEEFSRANISAVLGELMTYLEHRSRLFETPLTRRQVAVAPNLVLLATMNPRDRTALEVDDALIRRLRIIDCPPSTEQLREMLRGSLTGGGVGDGEAALIDGLARIFDECRRRHPLTYDVQMPFGHGVFAGIRTEGDLRLLWAQRLRHVLVRPQVPAHPFYKDILDLYPWRTDGAPAAAAER